MPTYFHENCNFKKGNVETQGFKLNRSTRFEVKLDNYALYTGKSLLKASMHALSFNVVNKYYRKRITMRGGNVGENHRKNFPKHNGKH